MIDFTFLTPAKIIFKQNSINNLPKEIKNLGKKVMVVSGRTGLRRAGITTRIEEKLNNEQINFVLYEQVEPEPSIETVDNGIKLGKKGSIDCVVGIGGGSVLDVSKAIAGMIPQDIESVREQVGRQLKKPGVPFIAIPTTAGTGSEITKNSVIIDRQREVKESILRDPLLLAKTVIIDPLLTLSMPPKSTASSGMDALTQAIECYVSRTTNVFSNILAIKAIQIISKNLKIAYKNGKNIQAREKMAFGSLLSALAFSNGGLGAVHGLAHPLGYLFNISHGIICALLLPHVMEFNREVKVDEFAKIGENLDPKLIKMSKQSKINGGIQYIRGLLSELNLPTRLSELGIEVKDIDNIVRRTGGSSLQKNPRETNKELLKELLKNAL